MTELHCEFNEASCSDNRCTTGYCAVSKDCEEAFRRRLPFTDYFPKNTEAAEARIWMLAFLRERKAVMRLVCRQSGIRYTAAVARNYINDPRVIFEAIRRIGRKLNWSAKL